MWFCKFNWLKLFLLVWQNSALRFFFSFFPRRSHQDYRVTFWKHLKMATQCARTPTYTQTSHTHTQILQTHKVERTGGRAGWEHSCRGHDSRRAKSFEALNSLLSAQIFLHKVDVMNNPAVQCSLLWIIDYKTCLHKSLSTGIGVLRAENRTCKICVDAGHQFHICL